MSPLIGKGREIFGADQIGIGHGAGRAEDLCYDHIIDIQTAMISGHSSVLLERGAFRLSDGEMIRRTAGGACLAYSFGSQQQQQPPHAI